jgi:hypothetical protein
MPALIDTITMFIGQCRRAYAKRLCVLAPRLSTAFLHFPTVFSFHLRLLPFCVKGHNVSVEQETDLTRTMRKPSQAATRTSLLVKFEKPHRIVAEDVPLLLFGQESG